MQWRVLDANTQFFSILQALFTLQVWLGGGDNGRLNPPINFCAWRGWALCTKNLAATNVKWILPSSPTKYQLVACSCDIVMCRTKTPTKPKKKKKTTPLWPGYESATTSSYDDNRMIAQTTTVVAKTHSFSCWARCWEASILDTVTCMSVCESIHTCCQPYPELLFGVHK